MDALPTKPVSVPLSSIRELRPAKTWKTWDNTVEVWTSSDSRIAVRRTLDEIISNCSRQQIPQRFNQRSLGRAPSLDIHRLSSFLSDVRG